MRCQQTVPLADHHVRQLQTTEEAALMAVVTTASQMMDTEQRPPEEESNIRMILPTPATLLPVRKGDKITIDHEKTLT